MRRCSRVRAPVAAMAMLAVGASCTSGRGWNQPESATARRDLVERVGERRGSEDALSGDAPAATAGSSREAEPGSPAAAPQARESLSLSVEEAVFRALRRNRDLAVQRLEPIITGTFERIERGTYNPSVFADVQHTDQRASEVDRGTRQQFDVEAAQTQSAVGIRQELPTGTAIETSLQHRRDQSDRSPEQQEARVALSVTQSLLEGLGPAVNLASVRQADLDTQASLHQLRGFLTSLLADVETAYWQLVLDRERIAIYERGLEVAKQQLRDIEQRIDVGTLAQTEAAAARAEVARRRQALIDADSELHASRLELARLVNAGPDGSLARPLEATSDPAIDPGPLNDVGARVELATRMRADLAEARVRLEQNRLETVVTSNGVLPKLDLFITVAKSGFADSFSESFQNLGGNSYEVTAGLSFEQALGNEIAEAEYRRASLSQEQAEAAVANLAQLIRLDVRQAANEVERARKQIAATEATRKHQENVVRAEQDRFDAGTATSLDVARAQRDLLQARVDEVAALVDYRIALVRLWAAEGSLPERHGIATVRDNPLE